MMKIDLLNKLEIDKKKLLLITIAWFFILYIDFNYLLKLQLNAIRVSGKKVTQLNKDIVNLNKEMAQLKNKQSGSKGAARLKERRLINEEQMPVLLQKIASVANKNKVAVLKIDPSREQKSQEGKPVPLPGITPFFISLDLIADYHSLGSFISGLENLEDFLAVQDIRITRDEKDYFKEKIALTLKTYVAK